MDIVIKVIFSGGNGEVTAKAFRNGATIDENTAIKTGDITLKNINIGDAISLNGVSAPGGTKITITVPTFPTTPRDFPAGPIMASYDVE